MARYEKSESALRAKILYADEKNKYEREKNELRKRRELMRRQVHAQLYEPRLCLGDPVTAQTCSNYALPGAGFCPQHGGTTKQMQAAARTRLLCLVEPALRVMNKCMASGDLNVALKAAQVVLDRSGFHPHATLEIKEQPMDFSTMSNRQLQIRAQKLIDALDITPADQEEPTEDSNQIIDMEETTESDISGKIH